MPEKRRARRRTHKMTWQRNQSGDLGESKHRQRIQSRENLINVHSSLRKKSYEDLSNLKGIQGIHRPNRMMNNDLMSFVADEIPLPPQVEKSEEVQEFLKKSLLHDNFIFAALSDEEMELLIGVMREQVIEGKGSVIVKEGDIGEFFYIVGKGTVKVVRSENDKNDENKEEDGNKKEDEKKNEEPTTEKAAAEATTTDNENNAKEEEKQLDDDQFVDIENDQGPPTLASHPSFSNLLTKGSSFGEMALIFDTPHDTTYVCESDSVTLWKVDQHSFRVLLAKNTESHEKKTSEILHTIPLFKDLGPEILSTFSRSLTPVTFKENERIVNKGDVGEVFYIIEHGQVRVHDIGSGLKLEDIILGPGKWFGERALLTGEPRAAHVTAITDRVKTLAVNRETFESVIGSLEDVLQHEMKKDSLKALPRFARSGLMPHEEDGLAEKLICETFEEGHEIQKIGELFERQLVIIRNGQITVTSSVTDKVRVLEEGDAFGSRNLLDDETKQKELLSTERAVCDEETEVFILKRKDIDEVVGDITRLGKHASYKSKRVIDANRIQFVDLRQQRVLGKGAFGSVYLTTHKDYKEPFALKCMDKRDIIEAKMVKFIVREKDILEGVDHPFLLPLYTSFQDDVNVYLLLRLIHGGELFYVIHDTKKQTDGLSNSSSCFYSACILDALTYIHHRHIIYRDLKPENILIDNDGYCVIVDFGFAKIVASGKTYTLCGTPDYVAPELILSKGHNSAADYWSFGVCIYEMLLGRTPFYEPGKDQTYMFTSIVKARYTIPDDERVNDDAKDLITKLLEKNATKRLGTNVRHGSSDIRDHPWFKSDVDFNKLVKKEIKAPWIPEVKDAMDASNFDNNIADNERKSRKKRSRRRKLKEEDDALFETFGV